MKRHVYFISDGTGITAEALGGTLITQFEGIDFIAKTVPFIDSPEKAAQIKAEFQTIQTETGYKPLVFTTLVNPAIRTLLLESGGVILDLFQAFLGPMETELGIQSSYTIERSHAIANEHEYDERIDAVNFALTSDDGVGIQHYKQADVIIVGVSRSGKTPTCLYLALQFGVMAANYPLTEEDLESDILPAALRPFKEKLYGLTISAERLRKIRQERRPNSEYASLQQCRREIHLVEALFKRESIPYLNATSHSIEEISTKLLQKMGITRHLY